MDARASKDARFLWTALLAGSALLWWSSAAQAASHRTSNFIVSAGSPDVAQQVGEAAEKYRRELAIQWLGQAMPDWTQPCPIRVDAADHLGAGGATSFVFDQGQVFGWQMSIQGSLERILDSVLPHEVTHTVFATHFRQPLPRWADEGACTTVEHPTERARQQKMLVRFLQTGRGIAFNQMFAMRDYPHDVLPLYAQGHSLVSFLIAQGGRHKFLNFVADGLQSEHWSSVTRKHYGYRDLSTLQAAWLDWVRSGSPRIGDPQEQLASAEPVSEMASATASRRDARPATYLQGADAPKSVPRGAARDAKELPRGRLVSVPNRQEGERLARGAAPASSADEWRASRQRRRSRGLAGPARTATDTADAASASGRGDVAAADEETPTATQATRPLPPEQARQVILEWDARTQANAPRASRPERGSVPGFDGPSIYEAAARQSQVR